MSKISKYCVIFMYVLCAFYKHGQAMDQSDDLLQKDSLLEQIVQTSRAAWRPVTSDDIPVQAIAMPALTLSDPDASSSFQILPLNKTYQTKSQDRMNLAQLMNPNVVLQDLQEDLEDLEDEQLFEELLQAAQAKTFRKVTDQDVWGSKFPTLSSWVTSCKSCPLNRHGASLKQCSGFLGSKVLQTAEQAWQEFDHILHKWFVLRKKLASAQLWQKSNTGAYQPTEDFFNFDAPCSFTPFAQKIIVPSGAQFYIRGDLHGDMFSLLNQLTTLRDQGVIDDEFRIIPDNVWILFLGDYVDRGWYGCEVLYTILRLCLANPERVVLVRGNHEDHGMDATFKFSKEVQHKFGPNAAHYEKIIRMYDTLPVVLYLGCIDTKTANTNYVQCCHGGIEIGYEPAPFLDNHITQYQQLGLLHRKSFINKFTQQQHGAWWSHIAGMHDGIRMSSPYDRTGFLGFMWNDFNVLNYAQVKNSGRGIEYGQLATHEILQLQNRLSKNQSKIIGIFRAHQHGDEDMMYRLLSSKTKGLYCMWDMPNIFGFGLVWMFNVGPDSVYGSGHGFNFDTYARLTVAEQLTNWKISVFNADIL
jgi:hypothetical protein